MSESKRSRLWLNCVERSVDKRAGILDWNIEEVMSCEGVRRVPKMGCGDISYTHTCKPS
jgi:hypothetical protein